MFITDEHGNLVDGATVTALVSKLIVCCKKLGATTGVLISSRSPFEAIERAGGKAADTLSVIIHQTTNASGKRHL
jgi:hypothetical protein